MSPRGFLILWLETKQVIHLLGCGNPMQTTIWKMQQIRGYNSGIRMQESFDRRAAREAAKRKAEEERQARIAAEHARYAAKPVDLSGAPAWWNIGGGGQRPQPAQPVSQPSVPQIGHGGSWGSIIMPAIENLRAQEAAQQNAQNAPYMAKPPNLQGAPAWWNTGGGGIQRPQQPQYGKPQLPVGNPSMTSMPVQRPQQPPPQFADVSKPRPALGIPNWRNYSSALRR
jgi:hypothetical protein